MEGVLRAPPPTAAQHPARSAAQWCTLVAVGASVCYRLVCPLADSGYIFLHYNGNPMMQKIELLWTYYEECFLSRNASDLKFRRRVAALLYYPLYNE